MRVLITGARGMLGLDVTSAATAAGHDVVALSRAELDISDGDQVASILRDAMPDVVINCAAYTNVDGAESDPDGAAAVNAIGPARLGAAASDVGAWTIHVSTDYVFDGSKRTPYLESDPPGPLSVYGATKLAGEYGLAAAAPDAHTIVRSAWLFGTGGTCFPATMLRLARERGALTVVEDQVGSPTYSRHLASALVALASPDQSAGRPLGVLHVAASGDCSWYQFAAEIMRRTHTEATVTPCTTAEFPRPAQRPAYSIMRSERGAPVLPDWGDGLDEYLEALGEGSDPAGRASTTSTPDVRSDR